MWTSDNEIQEIQDLLEFFSKNTYNAWDTHPKVHHVMQKCLDLFSLDYTYSVISNSNGELSSNYPSNLVVLERDKEDTDTSKSTTPTNGENLNSLNSVTPNGDSQHNPTSSYDGFNQELPKIKDLCSKARYARCRARFPIPVILFNKKHICRSATLSGGPEIYGRSVMDYLSGGTAATPPPPPPPPMAGASSSNDGSVDKGPESEKSETVKDKEEEDAVVPDVEGQGDWQLFDRVRNQDIRLLKSFQVQTIVDLMVEKKKVKFGVYVTSSEKVDKKNRYAEFNLISLPYPGCEFFKQYRDNGYSGEELMFEWNQGHDANIYVPVDNTTESLELEWSQYRKWDLVHLTQNYMKLLLAYLKGENNGMLIHCISGWDRTPLFVSLLRLSLWADGAIHKSLNAEQILYLTLAYDWLLFGHNLEDRLNKGEEILYFCFYFLTHMVDVQFSVDYKNTHCQPTTSSSESARDDNIPLQCSKPCDEEKENHANIDEVSCQLNSVNVNGMLQDHHVVDEHSSFSSPCDGEKENHVEEASCPLNSVNVNGTSTDHVDPYTSSSKPCDGEKQSHVEEDSCPVNSVNMNGTLQDHVDEHAIHSKSCDGEKENHVEEEDSCPLNSVNMNGTLQDHVDEHAIHSNPCDGENGNHTEKDSYQLNSVNTNGISNDHHVVDGHTTSSASPSVVIHDDCNGAQYPLINGLSQVPSHSNAHCQNHQSEIKELDASENNCSQSSLNGNFHDQNGTVSDSASDSPVPIPITKRSERLQLVRSHFYALYSTATQSRHVVNENTSGLSVIIDNIATKVGIRAPNRSTS